MNSLPSNIFDLKSPQDYFCAVKGFRHNHSMMLIRIGKDEVDPNAFYITFSELIYFEGVFRWKGAGFYLASKGELRELLIRLGYQEESLHVLLVHHHLFIAEEVTSGLKIKILAKQGVKSADIPGNFSWLESPIFGDIA